MTEARAACHSAVVEVPGGECTIGAAAAALIPIYPGGKIGPATPIRLDRFDNQVTPAIEGQVLAGEVWVTETPARGDRILREGEDFCLDGHYPYVFEALSEASMEVRSIRSSSL